MNQSELDLILAISEKPSFSAAAKLLGVAHTTVSRKLRDLESYFGAQLVERRGEQLILTLAGERLLDSAKKVREEWMSLERDIKGRDARLTGSISLTTVDILAWFYMHKLAEFRAAYPAIELQVHSGSEVISLSRREADVAIRLTNKPDDYLVGRQIGQFDFALYARHDLAAAAKASGQLSQSVWLAYSAPECAGLSANWMQRHAPAAKVAMTMPTPLLMFQAICQGLGVGFLPIQFVESMQQSQLEKISQDCAFSMGIWFLLPKELRQIARIRALLQEFPAWQEQKLTTQVRA